MASRDTASRSNYYYQMDAQKDAEKRTSNPKPNNPQPQSEHDIYCHQMGILFPHGLNHPYEIRKKSYFDERKREFRGHTQQYWLIATMTTFFFMLQIIIGAIQTALGAIKSPHLLVTVFGVIATVIGGALAYLKSRGQPNRARQLRNSLRKVVEEIEFQELRLRNPGIKTTAKESVDYINQLYENARFQAETNYPDFWSTAGTKASKPGSGATGPAATAASNQSTVSGNPSQPVSGVQRFSMGNRPPPSYHTTPRPMSANNTATTPRYSGLMSSEQATDMSREDRTLPQAPIPAHVPHEGGKPTHLPPRAPHVSIRGGRYMNEVV